MKQVDEAIFQTFSSKKELQREVILLW